MSKGLGEGFLVNAMGGGGNLSIPVLFVKTIEKVRRRCTVLNFYF